jgi:diguanylate cyclase (GGDEF)-like protein
MRRLGQVELDVLTQNNPTLVCTLLRETCNYLVRSESQLLDELRSRNAELEKSLDYLRRTREELDEKELLALTDELTGLYNRRGFNWQLPRFIDRARAGGLGLAVWMIDLDLFKPINDLHGHAAGDRVLIEVGDLIKSYVRRSDLPCRLGGDEFAVLVPDVKPAEAQARALELHRALTSLSVDVRTARVAVSASMGGTMWTLNEHPGDVVRRSDENLYAAKRDGRNCLKWAA